MCKQKLFLVSVLIWASHGMSAFAGPCDAHYQFNGDLSDASGSGHNGMMIGKDGVPITPRFVEGRTGQALVFDGASAMRAFIDLAYDRCPQVTVTAWIRAELHPQQVILGSSHGLFLMSSMSDIGLRVGGDDLWGRQAVFPNAGWMFVAGTWDMDTGVSTVFWRDRSVDASVGNSRMETEPAIWLGALNDNLDFVAKNLVIDELQIIGRSLNREQVMALQNSTPPGGAHTVTTTSQSAAETPPIAAVPDTTTAGSAGAATTTQSATTGAPASAPATVACFAPGECAVGSYCAVDQSCHPELHLPMREIEIATTPVQTQLIVPSESGSATAYLVCAGNSDCGWEGEQCYNIAIPTEGTEGSICTQTCTTDAQCGSARGFSGACYALGGNAPICYMRCDAVADCYIGSDCISVTMPNGSLDSVCVPN